MKVITAVVNNPIFIQIQFYTLKKYMKFLIMMIFI